MEAHARKASAMLVAALVFCASSVASAQDGVRQIDQDAALRGRVTPGDAPGFPVTISRSGSYRLSSNLRVNDPNVDGIQITVNNVTIDLNGFSVLGPGPATSGSGDGITAEAIPGGGNDDITVLNGSVIGHGRWGVIVGGGARVSEVRIENNGGGGLFVAAGGALSGLVSNNIVQNNLGTGILVIDGGTQVIGNTVRFSVGNGIASGGIVKGNTVLDTRGDGVFASNGALVIGNIVRFSDGLGLSLDGDAGYRENVLTQNNGDSANPQVSGGVSLGDNLCGTDTVCP